MPSSQSSLWSLRRTTTGECSRCSPTCAHALADGTDTGDVMSFPPRLTGIDHVQLAMPEGGEDAARAFYGGLLGLTEVPRPPALAGRGGCWFAAPGVAVHLGVETPFV